MAHLIALLASDGLVIDQLTGRVSVFNILDSVHAAKFPAVLPRIAFLCTYQRDAIDVPEPAFEQRCVLLAPDGSEVLHTAVARIEMGTAAVFNAAHQFTGARLNFKGNHRLQSQRRSSESDDWHVDGERLFVVQARQETEGQVMIGPHAAANQ